MTSTVDGPDAAQLVAEDIRVHYEGVRAVDGVSLTLRQGEIMGLIGPNGAGKTTFMNAVSAFVPLTTGRVTVAGVDVTGWDPPKLVRHGLARTFQDVATFPALTVFENIELGALGSGLGRREARRRAWDLLEGLGLRHRSAQPASALPHGDERRLGIARAVALNPRFLLLDEPAAGLDDRESEALGETIVRIRDDNGCGILLVEHDMHVIFSVCERIQVFDFGRSIAVGTAAEIRRNPAVIAAYLGQKGAEEVAEAG
jgi:branched-chain amino acid transport system ATP-binding protein